MSNNKGINSRSKDTATVEEFLAYLFDDNTVHTEEEIVARILIRNMAKRPHMCRISDKANTERRDF